MSEKSIDIQELLEMAVYAGELMLKNGAEMYRVEDTMLHILHTVPESTAQVFALTTGIFVTVQRGTEQPHFLMRRVYRHGSSLSRIYQANQVSREFCGGSCTLAEAMDRLRKIEVNSEYGSAGKNIGYALACGGFAMMLGGGAFDGALAALIGVLLLSSLKGASRLRLNDFLQSAAGAFVLAETTLLIWAALPLLAPVLGTALPSLKPNAVIIGCIMPLVPGVIFTTALRDILNGDYSSGIARIGETVVIALSVACGVLAAMRLFVMMGGDI